MRKCLECDKPLEGRSDKKFCNLYCKSSFQYKKTKDDELNLFRKIDVQLKLNRRLLKNYNKAGKAIIRKDELLKEGFNPKYFTHFWKNQKNDVYLFCYEFGFLEKKENGKEKFVLVTWQSYMEK
jgi:hypothetical protein